MPGRVASAEVGKEQVWERSCWNIQLLGVGSSLASQAPHGGEPPLAAAPGM